MRIPILFPLRDVFSGGASVFIFVVVVVVGARLLDRARREVQPRRLISFTLTRCGWWWARGVGEAKGERGGLYSSYSAELTAPISHLSLRRSVSSFPSRFLPPPLSLSLSLSLSFYA